MKTIFISIFQGVEAKNILRTDVYNELVGAKDVRLVLFVGSKEKSEYYKKEFSGPNVVYEVIKPYKLSGLNKFFSNLSFRLLSTETVELRRKMALSMDKKYFRYFIDSVLNKIIVRPFFRSIARYLDYRFVKSSFFSEYFDKYNPSIVFLAHLFDDLEINFLKEAKKRNIKTIGFINSWDKLTARNIIRVLPDKLLVFNNLVKEEAVRYADMKEKNIEVVGIPQYDFYLNSEHKNRENFCFDFDLDPKKKIIIYAPNGKYSVKSDGLMIDLLHSLIENNVIPNSQLIVRFQPNDFVDMEEIKKRPWLIYDIPGIRFSKERGVDWDMDFKDLNRLSDTLKNADLFICYTSSLSVDAALFNKPVINIDFEIDKIENPLQSPRQYYKMTHYKKALKTGGIKVVSNKENMIYWINSYLENSDLDKEGRERLVEEQCWKLDGKSGKRIADSILAYL